MSSNPSAPTSIESSPLNSSLWASDPHVDISNAKCENFSVLARTMTTEMVDTWRKLSVCDACPKYDGNQNASHSQICDVRRYYLIEWMESERTVSKLRDGPFSKEHCSAYKQMCEERITRRQEELSEGFQSIGDGLITEKMFQQANIIASLIHKKDVLLPQLLAELATLPEQ